MGSSKGSKVSHGVPCTKVSQGHLWGSNELLVVLRFLKGPSGVLRGHIGSKLGLWGLQVDLTDPRAPLGFCWVLRGPMVSYGILWGPMGSCRVLCLGDC